MLTIFIYSLYLQNIKRKAWAKYASPRTPRARTVPAASRNHTAWGPVKRNPEKERDE